MEDVGKKEFIIGDLEPEINASSDDAIDHEGQDCFQRKEFVNRVANLLKSRESHKSLSIGIYGKWGEGKTSILNMIKSNLADSQLRCIDFNPWMYSDEQQLLKMFFTTLRSELSSLEVSRFEKVGEWMKDYSEAIGGIAAYSGFNIEKGTQKIGSLLADKSLIKRKKEIDDALVKEGQKFVFIFDDIDRLSSDELFSIFRLIKLTGDFKNVSYILAFDDDIVAKMLSERYAGEGLSYLEKIIQLPLRIPKAQKYDLNKYLFERLNRLIEQNGYKLDVAERSNIQGSLNLYILPFVDNPRLIVRLTNALEFVFPMLVNQVNVEDLILIEWIKVSYPRVYGMIRENYGLLKANFSEREKPTYDFSNPTYKKEDLKNKLDPFTNNMSDIEKRQLGNLIIKLFPNAKSSLGNGFRFQIDYKSKYVEKRICSPDYFERYFTYIVLEGQISDTEFEEFISDLINQKVTKGVKSFLEKTDTSSLAFKLSMFSSKVSPAYTARFIKGLALITDYFPYQNTSFLSFDSSGLIKNIIGQGIQDLDNKEQLEVAKRIFSSSKNIEFTIQLWYYLRQKQSSLGSEHPMQENDFETLTKVLFELTRSNFTFKSLIEDLAPYLSMDMILLWVKQDVKIKKEALKFVNSSDDAPIQLVKTFCNWVTSSDKKHPYITEFSASNMDKLLKVVSLTTMEMRLTCIYGKHDYPKTITKRDELSDEEIVGIFQQYCRNRRKNQRRKRKNVK